MSNLRTNGIPTHTLKLPIGLPLLALTLFAALVLTPSTALAQANSTPPCSLEKHVYTCDGASFQKQLANAKNVGIETHSIDRFAQSQLTNLLTKKLGKTLVSEGSPADLIFLILPLGGEGVNVTPGETGVGTLRVYSVNPNNTRAELLWAEVFTGQEDLPWPTVVNGLILQFRSHFHIK
jgi:hypothetical protein